MKTTWCRTGMNMEEAMSCRIIIDSGGEITEKMYETGIFKNAALSIEVDGDVLVDDETLQQEYLLNRIAGSPNCPKSSCPSPEAYMDLYQCEEEHVYVITMSGELSGSYNSAILGMNLYQEEFGDKKIYVFDSKSASIGQSLVGERIQRLEEEGVSFEDIIQIIEKYIEELTTYFVLESLETLKKNGRLTGIKSVLATALNIKPVMSADKNGVIVQLGQARGIKKALVQMVDTIVADLKNPEDKELAIAHCNNRERAELVQAMLESKVKVKSIWITETSGISTLYANQGGIIIAV